MARLRSTLSGGRYALGEYRDLVTIEAPLTPDSDEYVALGPDLWAHVASLNGYERIQAAQLQTQIDYRVAIPDCPPDLNPTMRLRWTTSPRGAVVLHIRAVVPDVTETVCDCVEAHA